MSQSDPKAQQPRPNALPRKPGVTRSPQKAGLQKFWYAIPVFILVAVILVSYWIRKGGDGPPPVVSAAEESERVVDEEVVIEPEAEPEPEVGSASTTGALTITSDVRGADVYLNGKRVGKTPHKATPSSPAIMMSGWSMRATRLSKNGFAWTRRVILSTPIYRRPGSRATCEKKSRATCEKKLQFMERKVSLHP